MDRDHRVRGLEDPFVAAPARSRSTSRFATQQVGDLGCKDSAGSDGGHFIDFGDEAATRAALVSDWGPPPPPQVGAVTRENWFKTHPDESPTKAQGGRGRSVSTGTTMASLGERSGTMSSFGSATDLASSPPAPDSSRVWTWSSPPTSPISPPIVRNSLEADKCHTPKGEEIGQVRILEDECCHGGAYMDLDVVDKPAAIGTMSSSIPEIPRTPPPVITQDMLFNSQGLLFSPTPLGYGNAGLPIATPAFLAGPATRALNTPEPSQSIPDIFDSSEEYMSALVKHMATSHNYGSVPGVFLHGLQYKGNEQATTTGNTDAAATDGSRLVVFKHLHPEVRTRDVLGRIRGCGPVVCIKMVESPGSFGAYNSALVWFETAVDAAHYAEVARHAELAFEVSYSGFGGMSSTCVPTVHLAPGPSHPLGPGRAILAAAEQGMTRCLAIRDLDLPRRLGPLLFDLELHAGPRSHKVADVMEDVFFFVSPAVVVGPPGALLRDGVEMRIHYNNVADAARDFRHLRRLGRYDVGVVMDPCERPGVAPFCFAAAAVPVGPASMGCYSVLDLVRDGEMHWALERLRSVTVKARGGGFPVWLALLDNAGYRVGAVISAK